MENNIQRKNYLNERKGRFLTGNQTQTGDEVKAHKLFPLPMETPAALMRGALQANQTTWASREALKKFLLLHILITFVETLFRNKIFAVESIESMFFVSQINWQINGCVKLPSIEANNDALDYLSNFSRKEIVRQTDLDEESR